MKIILYILLIVSYFSLNSFAQENNSSDEDPNFVEYFFDLRVDTQIPEEDICNGILKLKRNDIYLDIDIDCIEREFASDIDIYNTGIVEADIEDCD